MPLLAECNLSLAAFQRECAYLESGICPAARVPAVREGAVNLMQAGLRIKLPGKYTRDLIYLEDAK